MITQEEDGHWMQNMWLDGSPYWNGVQMDQTAFPIMLVDLVNREVHLTENELKHFWPMIRNAASFLVTNGPRTDQDRWEENAGYSTFTLAVEIAALLIAAEYADLNNEPQVAVYFRETADCWNSCIERWTYVTGSELAQFVGVDGYYVRINSKEAVDTNCPGNNILTISNRPKGENACSVNEMVSPDALALVRFGLRAADDVRILNTIKVIDATLKMEGALGPVWYRYNGDGYGEHSDGRLFDGIGIGRPWPLLTGERAHYEIAAGNYKKAEKLLKTFEKYANETGLFPEQIWDSENIEEKGLFFSKPTGGATPLAWAHAEYIKLCRSLISKQVFDMPHQTEQRYLVEKTISTIFIWNFNNYYKFFPKNKILRLQCLTSAMVKWSKDNWATTTEVNTLDSGLGIHYADLPTSNLDYGQTIQYTFYWHDSANWEEKEYTLSVEKNVFDLTALEIQERNRQERDKIKVFLPS